MIKKQILRLFKRNGIMLFSGGLSGYMAVTITPNPFWIIVILLVCAIVGTWLHALSTEVAVGDAVSKVIDRLNEKISK